MKNKNILFNLNTFPSVGNIIPLVNKIKYWQKSGYFVTVLASHKIILKLRAEKSLTPIKTILIDGRVETSNKVGFTLECLRRNIISLKYIKEIERVKFPIIYTISSVLDLVLLPYILKLRRNEFIWLTVFDNTVPFTGTGNKLIRLLNWLFFKLGTRIIKKADKIFAISEGLKQYLVKKGFRKDQIVQTGNGVEVDLIKKAKKIESIKIDALFTGRINEAKGIYEMLKVLRIVKRKFSNFKLAMMGDGDEKTLQNFRDRINEMKLSDNIVFLGYKVGQEKFDLIKSSKSFWFLSETEGFPQALMEAVSSGLKCFVYYLPAYDYYKNNELCIFDQKDSRAVACAVIDLFDKKDFNNKAGRALLSTFSWLRFARIELESIR